jgi:quercetin dioxygenase-like cupin family protein
MVFSVGLEFFFDNNRNRHLVEVIRKGERKRFPERPGSDCSAYWFESLDFKASERKLNSFYAEFVQVPADKLTPHQHTGIEVLFVIDGTLALKIGGDDYELAPGDAIYFDSSMPHYYLRMNGPGDCRALVVTTG